MLTSIFNQINYIQNKKEIKILNCKRGFTFKENIELSSPLDRFTYGYPDLFAL